MRAGIYLIILGWLISSCKPTEFKFSEPSIYDIDVMNLLKAANISGALAADTRSLYVATLEDRFMIQDEVAEPTIVNVENSLSTSNPYINNTYKIYIVLGNTDDLELAFFLPAIFQNGKCIKLGPAYIGEYSTDRIVLQKIFKATVSILPLKKKEPTDYKWKYKKLQNEYLFRPRWNLVDGIRPYKINIVVDTYRTRRSYLIQAYDFTIKQITDKAPNRFGGFKPVVFDIPRIFGDSAALHFKQIKP